MEETPDKWAIMNDQLLKTQKELDSWRNKYQLSSDHGNSQGKIIDRLQAKLEALTDLLELFVDKLTRGDR